jgi:tRNA1Val (adenine37-N6)-methyltransferase
MRKPFRFKQFDIFQDQTAMKVGTDGVLLGAWANLKNGNKILDIGTGTGLISLMLAQRFKNANIDAVEIDLDAYNQAKENFLNSKFQDRITIHQGAIQTFDFSSKYDLIVSNPPFFIKNDRVEVDARKLARQQETLTFSELLEKTSLLLSANGLASFIIPFDLEDEFIEIAKQFNLYSNKILHVKGNYESIVKRSLIELSFNQVDKIDVLELVVESSRHCYTEDYINLTKDFYLKM